MNMMENQTRQYSNEELRARFNPEGSLLWKHQQRNRIAALREVHCHVIESVYHNAAL